MKKTRISAIVSMDEKRGIGKGNRMMWHITKDLMRLKNLTKDHIVLLGRKTYDSMLYYYNKSGRPMPGKLYIIITRNKDYKPGRDNAVVMDSPEKAFAEYEGKIDEIFIIGGAQIFQQTFPLLDRLYLTIVKGDYNADTYFPDYSAFAHELEREEGDDNGILYTFLTLEK